MSRIEQVKAAISAIKARVNKGENLHKILHEVAPDLREIREIKSFMSRGFKLSGSEQTDGYTADTPADVGLFTLKDYEASETGAKGKLNANAVLARAHAGEKYQDVEAMPQRAKIKLARSDDLEKDRIDMTNRSSYEWNTDIIFEQQLMNEQALADVQEISRHSLLERGTRYSDIPEEFKRKGADDSFRTQININREIRDLLKKIEEKFGKNPALTAPPAGFFGARQAY